MLGKSLEEDEQVYILAYKPGVAPDESVRQRALASIQQTFAKTEQQRGVADAEIDKAVDKAMRQIRYGKP